MKSPIIGLALAVLASVGPLQAQTYPDKPLKLMVGFAPGGPNDILGRIVAAALEKQIGQPVVVENLPGRSGNNATEAVVKAAPDGYTLLLVGPANAINISLYNDLSYDFVKDIKPVAGITREALVMVVHPTVPATTVPEFMDYIAKDPAAAELKVASTGNGSAPHITAVLFNTKAKLDLPMEHFQGGGPALKDIIAGTTTKMMFEPMSASIEPVRSGALRALAVTTAERSANLPDVPVMADFLPGFEASAVTGIGVPAQTPDDIVQFLNTSLQKALTSPEVQAELLNTGGAYLAGSPSEFAEILAGEITKWGDVITAANIKVE